LPRAAGRGPSVLIEAADGYMALEPHPAHIVTALQSVADIAKQLNLWPVVEKYRLCMLKCVEDAEQPPQMTEMLLSRYVIAVAGLQQGRVAEAEADLAKAVKIVQQDNPSSLSSALSCCWYAESQTPLRKHEIAAEHYAMFVSYQSEVPTGKEESYATWGRGWAALQRWAWEELKSYL
jgi:hypothetical protein